MTIAPVRCEVTVKAPPERAFELFATQMGRWWPRGMTTADKAHADIVIEPRAGGRWFERADDGTETPWGEVKAYEPPRRLLLDWKLGADFRFDPAMSTDVELTFEPAEGGARVILEHRNLERFGDQAEKVRGQISGGWPTLMGHYADLVSQTVNS